MNKPKKLIIHHSAVNDSNHSDFEAIRKYHMETNGWSDIGYHYLIENVNGCLMIKPGRPEKADGAHTKGINTCSIGICLNGNFDLLEPSKEQYNILAGLCATLLKKYKLTIEDIEPHNKYANKTCPGKKFSMDKLKQYTKQLLGGNK